jgi:hypothetical protein
MSYKPSKHIILLYALLNALALAGLWSCRKDEDTFTKYPVSSADLMPLLAQIPGPATKTTFTLNNLDKDTMLVAPSGIRVFLTDTDNLFVDQSGNPAACSTCQNFSVEVVEVRKKSDALARALPTTTSGGAMLEGGLMVFVEIRCNGQIWQLAPDRQIKIQLPDSNQTNGLRVYNAEFDNTTFKGWQDASEPVYLADWYSPTAGETVYGYEIFSRRLGWIFAAQPLVNQTSSFCVELPIGFSGENTQVYMIVKNKMAIAALQSDTEAVFCFDEAPVGYLVRIVTVSQYAGQYWLGNWETEIGVNGSKDLEPKVKTEQEVLNFLRSL